MRWAPAALAALLFAVAPAESQVGRPTPTPAPGRRPVPTRPDTVRGRADSVAARDTIARANFAPPDSVMLRLLNTPGYTVTQYQGEQISFALK